MKSAASTLQLHLPEHFAAPAALGELPLRWALRAHGRVTDGASPIAAIPRAEETCLVLPVARVAFVRAALPPGPTAKLAKLAPFAIEDAVASAPEDIVATVLDDMYNGERLIAVVDRAWLEAALAALGAHGIRPTRAIVESALVGVLPATWTVVWSGNGGFAASESLAAITLDASTDGRPPLSLKLAIDERRRRGDAPKAVRVLLASGADAPDTGRWAESLHVPVTVAGDWLPLEASAAAAECPNLLAGATVGGWSGKDLATRFRPAAILAVGILAAHGVLTLADWSRLAYEARGLRSDIEAAFRKAFPDAKAVVDPALQMRRNVADLRRAAGEPDATDFVPVLARLAPALAAAGLRPQSLRYERGELALDLAVAPDDTRDKVASRLRVPGLRVQVERIAAGAGGPVATVRIGVAS